MKLTHEQLAVLDIVRSLGASVVGRPINLPLESVGEVHADGAVTIVVRVDLDRFKLDARITPMGSFETCGDSRRP